MNQRMMNTITDAINMLEAYRNDPMIRERCNEKGLYLNFQEASVGVTLYMTDEVHDSSYYHEFSEICASLTSEDQLIIFIDNGGGYLSGAQFITRIIENSMAYTYAIVTDMAASAATIIALSVDELIMNPHSYFMIHAIYLEAIYKDFLTDDEISEVIKGTDIYLTADEVMERFQNIQDKREAVFKEAEAEHIKDHIESLKNSLKQLEARLPEEKPLVKPKAKPKAKA
jgi:ATP-dependent protease ClpP protease subunit